MWFVLGLLVGFVPNFVASWNDETQVTHIFGGPKE
jgi:hypothetical protein